MEKKMENEMDIGLIYEPDGLPSPKQIGLIRSMGNGFRA